MNKYYPIILLDIKSLKRIYLLFEVIFWPIMALATFGLFAQFAKISFDIKNFLFTGAIGWSVIQISQHAVGRGFMVGIWDRSIKQTLTTPLSLTDILVGHWMYGILAAFAGFFVTALTALAFFDFNFFSIGLYVFPLLFLATICGFVIGAISVAIILWVGTKIDILIWTLVQIVVFISGVYYSITIFPQSIQFISYLFPAIYFFEGIRQSMFGLNPLQSLFTGYLVSVVWLFISLILLRIAEKHAKKTGFFQKYG